MNTNFDQLFSAMSALGTAANFDVGVAANNIVQLNGAARLPAVDGSLLTNLPSGITAETTRTINFTNAMTTAQIQAAIDAVGKYIPTGVTVTFQFANGTYNLTSAITWQGYFGGGQLMIQGDTTEAGAATLHTTQNVFLDFSGQNSNGVSVLQTAVLVTIQNLKVLVKSDAAQTIAIYCNRVSGGCNVTYNYALGTSTANGVGVWGGFGNGVEVSYTYVSNINIGILAYNNIVNSYQNGSTGTNPVYGVYGHFGGHVGRAGTQPTGSTGNTGACCGGIVP